MSTSLLTRAQFRDNIRRKLGIVPPIDVVGFGGFPGQQPTNYPYPTNTQINDALNDAVSDINRECGFSVDRFDVPVPAADSSTYGPYAIDLSTLTPTTSTSTLVRPNARILDVLRVLWTGSDSQNVPILLTPTNRNQMDKGAIYNYYATLPSLPSQWYIESYTLWITPAQANSGTYNLTCGTGITGLSDDSDTLNQVPTDYQSVFEYQAIVRLSKTYTMDVEAQERAAMFAPDAVQGMKQFKAWKEGGSGTVQPGFTVFSYRTGYGTRRVVR